MYYQKAAEQGWGDGQLQLGTMYFSELLFPCPFLHKKLLWSSAFTACCMISLYFCLSSWVSAQLISSFFPGELWRNLIAIFALLGYW